MEKLIKNNFFIISIFAISTLLFTFLYENSNNFISESSNILINYLNDPSIADSIAKFSLALQNVQLQFPLRFLSGLFVVYINSSLLFILIKLWSVFSKTPSIISFSTTTNIFYRTLYISTINNILLSIFMLITKISIDALKSGVVDIFSFWTLTSTSFIIIYTFKKNNYSIVQPIIYFSLNLLLLILIKYGGIF